MRNWRRAVVVILIVLVPLFVGARLLRVHELARIGAGYAAEQTCSCLFVSKRTLASCRGDLEPLAQWTVSLAPGDGEVTARAFGLAHATARYQPGFGCAAEP